MYNPSGTIFVLHFEKFQFVRLKVPPKDRISHNVHLLFDSIHFLLTLIVGTLFAFCCLKLCLSITVKLEFGILSLIENRQIAFRSNVF